MHININYAMLPSKQVSIWFPRTSILRRIITLNAAFIELARFDPAANSLDAGFQRQSRYNVHPNKFLKQQLRSVRYFDRGNIMRRLTKVTPSRVA